MTEIHEVRAFETISAAEICQDYLTVAICYKAIMGVIPYRIWIRLTPVEHGIVGPMTQNGAYKVFTSRFSADS